MVLIIIIVLSFKLLVTNNIFIAEAFYQDIFSNDLKNKYYKIEGETVYKIIEIGKKVSIIMGVK